MATNVKPGEPNLFRTLAPDMIKATRLLVVDHDVTRYHSFDLLRYQLYLDAKNHDLHHFASLRPEHRRLAVICDDPSEQVYHAKTQFPFFNIYDGFTVPNPCADMVAYVAAFQPMFRDPEARVVETDVSGSFDLVFQRPNITGFLLRHPNDPHKPLWYPRVTVYEDPGILTPALVAGLIRRDRINALMVSHMGLAIEVARTLEHLGHDSPITFLVARYAYNFQLENGTMLYPIDAAEVEQLSLAHHHEFGFFEPFGGLVRRFHRSTTQGGMNSP